MSRFLVFYRSARWLELRGFHLLAMAITLIGRLVTGAWIPPTAHLGKGTTLGYGGSGVVIHSRAVIGEDCVICPGVLIGGRGPRRSSGLRDDSAPDGPVIGDRVNLWPGAKVVGFIHIGDDSDIGANAVVIHDLPANSRAVAPLARVL